MSDEQKPVDATSEPSCRLCGNDEASCICAVAGKSFDPEPRSNEAPTEEPSYETNPKQLEHARACAAITRWGERLGCAAPEAFQQAVWLCAKDLTSKYRERDLDNPSSASPPIPMVLHCPECRTRHIDEGDFATKTHHTHSCQGCGLTWRPSVVHTVGVQLLPGFKNDKATSESPYIGLRKLDDRLNLGEIRIGAAAWAFDMGFWSDAERFVNTVRELFDGPRTAKVTSATKEYNATDDAVESTTATATAAARRIGHVDDGRRGAPKAVPVLPASTRDDLHVPSVPRGVKACASCKTDVDGCETRAVPGVGVVCADSEACMRRVVGGIRTDQVTNAERPDVWNAPEIAPRKRLYVTHDRKYGTRMMHENLAAAEKEKGRDWKMIDIVEYAPTATRPDYVIPGALRVRVLRGLHKGKEGTVIDLCTHDEVKVKIDGSDQEGQWHGVAALEVIKPDIRTSAPKDGGT